MEYEDLRDLGIPRLRKRVRLRVDEAERLAEGASSLSQEIDIAECLLRNGEPRRTRRTH